MKGKGMARDLASIEIFLERITIADNPAETYKFRINCEKTSK
jgi:hypothetical protein